MAGKEGPKVGEEKSMMREGERERRRVICIGTKVKKLVFPTMLKIRYEGTQT